MQMSQILAASPFRSPDQTKLDFRLAADSEARGKGEALPWANGGQTTPADLGAIPFGGTAPYYGIRAEGAAR